MPPPEPAPSALALPLSAPSAGCEGPPQAPANAANDEMAAGVYSVAHRRGLRIPDDLSVVGYDDSDLACQLWPALTTLHLPVRDVGRQAAERLLQDEATTAPLDEVFLALVVRDSTAPPRT